MDILYDAPWWIYVLFVVTVIIGLKSSRTRTISASRLLLLPAIFTLLSIFWMAESLNGRYFLLIFWILGLILGVGFGWQSVHSWKTKADLTTKKITLPATWSTLALILAVFAARYFFVYNYEFHPE